MPVTPVNKSDCVSRNTRAMPFVNNYCPSYANLRLEEDRYRNAIGPPAGFASDVSLSRSLTYVLRHGAEKEGFKLLPGGFLNVSDILQHRRFRNKCSVDDVKRIVAQDEKQRYLLRCDAATGELQIRANQGHTIAVADDGTLLQPVTFDSGIQKGTHGTGPSAWYSIRHQGISRMKRNHIHMVPGEVDGSNLHLCGIRHTALILIVIDVRRALFDGIKFFTSRNGVLLSPGDAGGFIQPCYFERVINVRTGADLLLGSLPSLHCLSVHVNNNNDNNNNNNNDSHTHESQNHAQAGQRQRRNPQTRRQQ